MKSYYPLLFLILFLFVSGCKENDGNTNQQPPEGCINLSELETKQDYHLPFALENDIDNIRLAVLNNDTIDFQFGDFIDFSENGFYELILLYKDTDKENDIFLFTTTTEEREGSEWGISAWVPAPFKTISLGPEEVVIAKASIRVQETPSTSNRVRGL
jgi:hypothetical protein